MAQQKVRIMVDGAKGIVELVPYISLDVAELPVGGQGNEVNSVLGEAVEGRPCMLFAFVGAAGNCSWQPEVLIVEKVAKEASELVLFGRSEVSNAAGDVAADGGVGIDEEDDVTIVALDAADGTS